MGVGYAHAQPTRTRADAVGAALKEAAAAWATVAGASEITPGWFSGLPGDVGFDPLGLSKQAVRFTFDGRRLQEQDRPEACGVEDGDEIDVFQEQQGGAGGASWQGP